MNQALVERRLADIRCVALDLDGTVYKGKSLFEWTNPFLALLRELGIDYDFLTNNSSRSASDYVRHLTDMGLDVTADQVFTSGLATIECLRSEYPQFRRVFLLGTDSLAAEFKAADFELVEHAGQGVPDAVVVAFDTSLEYDRLCAAGYWIKQGKPFIATHPDLICPTDRETLLVDCGAICASLQTSTGRAPDVIVGKPDPRMLAGILVRHDIEANQLAMVGDRLYTDIAMANASGSLGVLVLSGEATKADVQQSSVRPDLVVANLAELGQLLRRSGSQRRSA
jgi:HAD superfamily hydrolase (TIGR01450 family)